MTTLVIFTTHPIQYQVPWFRALAAVESLAVEVVFSYLPNSADQGVGFNANFHWDIPLLTGYPYHILSTISLPRPLPAFARNWSRGISRLLDDLRPDVAMILGWQEVSLVQALLTCRRRGIPVIMRGESNALRPRRRLVSMLHRYFLGLCDVFISIGSANEEFYRLAGVPASRILRAGYFVDNDRFSSSAESLRSQRSAIRRAWSIPEEATCFAFVGKLEPKKCVLDYLGALSLARDNGAKAVGLVVGNGVQLLAAQRMVAERNLPVTFAGFLNQSEISRAYVAADALVLPSDYGETWGLVVNEAMASCLPPIVSDRIGAANDLVVDGRTGLIFPHGNTTALAEAMTRLAADINLCRSMGKAAQAFVRTGYSVTVAVERTREAVQLALRQRNGAT